MHPRYNPCGAVRYDNDIAILKLGYPLYFNEYVQPACLPDKWFLPPKNEMAWVSGWGMNRSEPSKEKIFHSISILTFVNN